MDKLKIGQLINEPQERDAIHVATIPVVAGHKMYPGEHVGISGGVASTSQNRCKLIGVVDPFLPNKPLKEGDKFWLFLYPGSITSLRHHWTHPEIEKMDKEVAQKIKIEEQHKQDTNRNNSVEWLKNYAIRHVYSEWDDRDAAYERLIAQVEGGDLTFFGRDCHGLHDVPDSDELFRHLSVVLDRTITEDEFSYFSCSC
jgi:hypothetical protein